jgi:hypothetical protein
MQKRAHALILCGRAEFSKRVGVSLAKPPLSWKQPKNPTRLLILIPDLRVFGSPQI